MYAEVNSAWNFWQEKGDLTLREMQQRGLPA